MHMLRLILIPFVILLSAPAATAEKIPLADISAYFNEMTTAQAEFTQINDDGSISTGEIFIRRPGRIRFKYNPPDDSLVLASGGQVAVFDPKSNQPPERFPLAKTPLSLILARKVDFVGSKMVVAHGFDGTLTTVDAQDPRRPELGSIQLVFTDNPIALRQWIVTDGSGQSTTLILGELNLGRSLRASIFDIRREMTARGF